MSKIENHMLHYGCKKKENGGKIEMFKISMEELAHVFDVEFEEEFLVNKEWYMIRSDNIFKAVGEHWIASEDLPRITQHVAVVTLRFAEMVEASSEEEARRIVKDRYECDYDLEVQDEEIEFE